MTKFSANLGFLWSDLPLPDAIRATYTAGFDAVECHWPYDQPVDDVADALEQTGLPMLGLNTRRGNTDKGENGLCALAGRQAEARDSIDEAISYASKLKAKNVHVMCGFAKGEEAGSVFVENLTYACAQAAEHNITILIEPLNKYDAPGYFLTTTDQAIGIARQVDAKNLKLMFDCYHVQLMEGDLTHRLKTLLPHIGHIQFASVPDRGPPDQGELNYRYIFKTITDLGYNEPLGAEFKPNGPTAHSLGWMARLR